MYVLLNRLVAFLNRNWVLRAQSLACSRSTMDVERGENESEIGPYMPCEVVSTAFRELLYPLGRKNSKEVWKMKLSNFSQVRKIFFLSSLTIGT